MVSRGAAYARLFSGARHHSLRLQLDAAALTAGSRLPEVEGDLALRLALQERDAVGDVGGLGFELGAELDRRQVAVRPDEVVALRSLVLFARRITPPAMVACHRTASAAQRPE